MKTDFWIRVGARQSKYGLKPWEFFGVPHASRSKPDCGQNEISFKIDLEIPDAYFEAPQIAFKVAIPDRTPRTQVAHIDPKQLGDAIAEQIGMRVSVTIQENANG